MGKLVLVTILVMIVLLIGGGVYLAFWDIPAPATAVEKILPDAIFPK